MKVFLSLAVAITCFLSGCISNPINRKTAAIYYEQGREAEKNGDFALARQNYSRAYANAQMGSLGSVAEAQSMYEWSRVTGYLGKYDEAEKGFNDVLGLIEKSKGKADNLKPPALSELARLFHDTNQHGKAVPIYEKALVEFEKLEVVKIDPIGFALILDDYEQSLRATGLASRAEEIKKRSQSIKEANKGERAKFIGRRYNISVMVK